MQQTGDIWTEIPSVCHTFADHVKCFHDSAQFDPGSADSQAGSITQSALNRPGRCADWHTAYKDAKYFARTSNVGTTSVGQEQPLISMRSAVAKRRRLCLLAACSGILRPILGTGIASWEIDKRAIRPALGRR